MFKNLKLGTRIVGGFGAVLLINTLVTAFVMVEVGQQSARTSALSTETVPQVQLATSYERNINRVGLSIRQLGYTRDQKDYEAARQELAQAKGVLTQARELSTQHPALASLKSTVERLEPQAQDYDGIIVKTWENIQESKAARAKLDEAAKRFSGATSELRTGRGAEGGKVLELALEEQTLRALVYDAEASHSPALYEKAVTAAAGLQTSCGGVQPISRPPARVRVAPRSHPATRSLALCAAR